MACSLWLDVDVSSKTWLVFETKTKHKSAGKHTSAGKDTSHTTQQDTTTKHTTSASRVECELKDKTSASSKTRL